MSTPEQISGQQRLEGTAEVPIAASPMHKNMSARRAFGGLVTPEFWRLDPTDYEDITDQMVELVAPNMLRSSIMGVTERNEDKFVVDSIALSPEEYKFVPRGVAAIGRAVTSTALSGKLQLVPREAAVIRAADKKSKILQRYHDRIEIYLGKTLQPQKRDLEFLLDMSQSPGYSRGKHIDIYQKATQAKDVIFPNMLDVIGDQREWTEDQRALASRSLDKRLLMTGRKRVGHWREWLRFANTYNEARQIILKRRKNELETHLR